MSTEHGADGQLASYPFALPGPLSPSAPERAAHSVRRTSNLDMIRTAREQSTGVGLGISEARGTARDLVTYQGVPEGAGEATLLLTVDTEGRIDSIETSPATPTSQELLGARIGFGFRSQAKGMLQATSASLLGLLVDDLSGATAASGYASIRERTLAGLPSIVRPEPVATSAPRASIRVIEGATQTNVCAGWRAGGIPTLSRETGAPMPLGDAPVAPPLVSDDPHAWHAMDDLEPGSTRRLRRLDLTKDGGWLTVDAMFRDICVDPDGTPRVVHEYALSASIDAQTRSVVAIHADPRVLPFATDCPFAAGHVENLVGHTVDGFRTGMSKILSGTSSCTHLNDLLRSLADVVPLAAVLAAR
jgi:hypothetical protein